MNTETILSGMKIKNSRLYKHETIRKYIDNYLNCQSISFGNLFDVYNIRRYSQESILMFVGTDLHGENIKLMFLHCSSYTKDFEPYPDDILLKSDDDKIWCAM